MLFNIERFGENKKNIHKHKKTDALDDLRVMKSEKNL